MRLDGTLEDYPLSDIFQLIFMGNRSGTLIVFSHGDEGKIIFGDNLVRFGKTGEFCGLKAAREILSWKSGKFILDTEDKTELGDEERIELPVQQFILELSTEMDECADLMSRVGGLERKLILAHVAPKAKPITLSPVEWQVVVHMGDAPTVRQLKSRLALEERDLLRVIVDLCDRGLLSIE